jgi:hypothetical protein
VEEGLPLDGADLALQKNAERDVAEVAPQGRCRVRPPVELAARPRHENRTAPRAGPRRKLIVVGEAPFEIRPTCGHRAGGTHDLRSVRRCERTGWIGAEQIPDQKIARA